MRYNIICIFLRIAEEYTPSVRRLKPLLKRVEIRTERLSNMATTKKTIRIGVIGFGSMGKTHAFAVSSLPYYYDLPFRAEIAGVTTRSIEKSESVCREYGFQIAAASEDDLINDPTIDVIDICTPNTCHKDTILKVMAAGKHILCEKPLATTAEEALILHKEAKKNEARGKVCGVVFNNRNHAAILRAKELIEEGALGAILSFRADYLHNSCLDPNKSAGWKQDATICGKGGVLFDLGSHVLDLVYYLCGRVKNITSMSQIAFPERRGMDGSAWKTDASEAFYLLAELECGAVGTITASKLTSGANDDLNIEVFGSKGSLRFSLMNPNYLYYYDGTAPSMPLGGSAGYTAIECVGRYPAPGGIFPSVKAANGWLRGHIHGMYRFLDAVHTADSAPEGASASGLFAPSMTDASYIQCVMDAAMQSAESGKRCAVAFPPEGSL